MFMWNIYVLVTFTLTALFVRTTSSRLVKEDLEIPPDKPVRYCGSNIPDALEKLCDNTSPEPKDNFMNEEDSGNILDTFVLYTQTVANRYNLVVEPGRNETENNWHRRRARGIVDECCKIPCTQETLRTYCPIPNSE